MLRDWSAFHVLAKTFAEGPVCLRIAGLTGAARALAVAELLQAHPRPALVLVESMTDAHHWTQDLKFFGAPALEFPGREPRLWRGGRQREADAERAVICRRLAAGEPVVVVVTPEALDAEIVAPGDFASRTLRLAKGDSLDRELLLEALERAGYERVDTVVEVGQWSPRGGIVDVFSPSHASPARVEFFGDEIESIRLFDPTSQRSSTPLDELLVLPLVAQRDGSAPAGLTDYVPAAAPIVVDVPRVLDALVLTEAEIFGARRRLLRRPKYQRGAELTAFTDLAVGDIVVHEDHGLGRYLGLKTMTVGNREGDFLVLEYAEGNQLYLPVERLDLVSKYLGADAGAVRLDRLGGVSWPRVKESVRAALRQMAEALLRLYAQRAVADGHACSPDTSWQREFEAAFRFEETPDQLRAIEEVKRDLEARRPMDRLVAGDVGYGKTEVALRAAFKVVADGMQAAVLVPTTVLAQQHWTTFADRFAAFPARVELLSRFRSPKEQKAVIEGLRQGTVDVVIGTHRLLSKDVAFKHLGLLVVDEEHRFGVVHKERMKELRASVDVLALTATPIPRTLYMSLAGVRDMSVIETPPLDRLPVETVIRRFSKAVIKEALTRELERGGQVFFVHNRVQSLPSVTRFVQELVPEARVIMAHGQMKERELEATMVKFVSGQADVLVATAIVESGLDIPATNTIVVNRADRFGLAQLYQLRGRVGRERQQAYAYLLVPADGRVDEQAQRRLRALQEFTELGSGFKLALRDLEIRGAGNLLGAEQHGHIAAVGFDLYAKLLAEAVRELKGEPASAAVEPVISVAAEGFLPDAYVPEVNQRLAFYKRLAGAVSDPEVDDLRGELVDRFGPLPEEAEQLLDIVHLRVAARRLGVEKLEAGEGVAFVTCEPGTPLDPRRLVRAIEGSRGRLQMKREFTIEAVVERGEWARVRGSLLRLLESLDRS